MSGALKLFKIAHNELDATICEGTRRVGESRCMDWIKPVTVVQVKQPRSALVFVKHPKSSKQRRVR